MSSIPEVSVSGPVITLRWSAERVLCVFDRWRDGRDSEPRAEVTVTTSSPGFHSHLLQGQLNLVALRSRSDVATRLQKTAPDLTDWPVLVEQACVLALRTHRQGEPTIRLEPDLPDTPPTWLVHPIVYERMPTVLFGHGGVSKSYVCLFLSLLVESGGELGRLRGLRGKTLYLDYESDLSDALHRTAKFRRGHPVFEKTTPLYRRMSQPLDADLPALQRVVAENEVRLIVVDSLAMACGGHELADPSTATRYYGALRTLPCASLTIAHMPKATETPTIYGTVFFETSARMTWEVKKVQEIGGLAVQLGLYNRKYNGRPQRPVGLTLTHAEDDSSVTVEPLELGDVDDLAESLSQRLQHQLRSGAKTSRTLADLLDVPLKRVCETLAKGRGEWVLPLHEGRGAEWILMEMNGNGRAK